MGKKSDSTQTGGVGHGPKAHHGKIIKTAHLNLTFTLPGTQINDLKTENSGPLSDPDKIAECLNTLQTLVRNLHLRFLRWNVM